MGRTPHIRRTPEERAADHAAAVCVEDGCNARPVYAGRGPLPVRCPEHRAEWERRDRHQTRPCPAPGCERRTRAGVCPAHRPATRVHGPALPPVTVPEGHKRCHGEVLPLSAFAPYAQRNPTVKAKCRDCEARKRRAAEARKRTEGTYVHSRTERLRRRMVRFCEAIGYPADLCWLCGGFAPDPDVEHVWPKARGGAHRAPWNLLPAHPECNRSGKGDAHPVRWLRTHNPRWLATLARRHPAVVAVLITSAAIDRAGRAPADLPDWLARELGWT